jgi:phospholipid-binding lipoprotein MlaA
MQSLINSGVRVGSLLLLAAWILSGCASLSDIDLTDPLEPINRDVDRFNHMFDNAIGKPVARGYRNITPDPLDRGISNFFDNLSDINSAVNNLLQLRPHRALSDVGRLSINTTVGLLGFLDLATDMGFKSYKEDLGQTLGFWGVGDTPYLVIPILGPSNLRDFVGQLGDLIINPIYYTSEGVYWSLLVLRYVDIRADLLETSDMLEEAAVDQYSFVRETYQQNRKHRIHNGAMPIDETPFEDEILFDDELPPIE